MYSLRTFHFVKQIHIAYSFSIIINLGYELWVSVIVSGLVTTALYFNYIILGLINKTLHLCNMFCLSP